MTLPLGICNEERPEEMAWTFDDHGLIMRMQGHMDDAEYRRQLNGEPR
jgi:hypothetical protein